MKCRSGRHEWMSQDDADKCCHPDWVRVMDSKVMMPYFNVVITFRWVKKQDLAEEERPKQAR